MAIKTVHTSDIQDYIKECKSFELIWDENKTELLAFFTPLWHLQTAVPVSPAVSPAETNSKSDIILLLIYYIIYILRRILTEVKLTIIHSPKNFSIDSMSTPKRRSCRWTAKWRFALAEPIHLRDRVAVTCKRQILFVQPNMLKVCDQKLCQTGTVYYTHRPCGRYDEHKEECNQ